MEKLFNREFVINVPANGLFGSPTSREQTFQFQVPDGFTVKRDTLSSHHGAIIVGKNLEGMEEKYIEFTVITNGVELTWKVANPHSFPLGGRTASMKVQLTGIGTKMRPHLQFSDKYQKIRQRFFDKFYFQGHVAEFIEDDYIKFADQTIYMGQTLIFLASEIAIKCKLGQDTAPSIQKIQEILSAIEQLDQDAETLFGHSSDLNGFIVRDNITGHDDARLLNRFARVDSDWQKPQNATPSADQIFGLFFGFWALVNLVNDDSVVTRTREISDRIFLYVKNSKFELKLPNGDAVARGADMRWLSSLLHGLHKGITGISHFDECRIIVLGQELKLTPIAAFWDDVGNQSVDILSTNINIPILGEQSINSFAVHMLLMAIAPSEVWAHNELEKAAMSANHHLAVLIYALAHNHTPEYFGFSDIQTILDKCPDNGPRSDLPVDTGWQKDNRWIRAKDIGDPGSGHKEYNGVDFLLLHNLALIVFWN